MVDNTWIFDIEVFAFDWLIVFQSADTGEVVSTWNDNEAVRTWMEDTDPFIGGFNNKHYDNHILKSIICDFTPEQVKAINDQIIIEERNGWEIPELKQYKVFFHSFDLLDDCQDGVSLKGIEAHLGLPIRESTVDFNIQRPLTEAERKEVEQYCRYDVGTTMKLYHLRKDYLENKENLGKEAGMDPRDALYMTNAKLTATYLKAKRPETPWTDERKYVYPDRLKREYIPQEVFDYFNRMYDSEIPDEELYSKKLELTIGDCPCTIGYGGIHGAIRKFNWKDGARIIRNFDVASYYPHLMTLYGYTSRNMANPSEFAGVLERRIKAKKAGNKPVANALKLVANTTYGASLSTFNDLYDPLMGRSVCITGQLFLLELAEHLYQDIPELRIVQLNTDGIMIEFEEQYLPKVYDIVNEWQERTGFTLEEDKIKQIIQKDVNGYIEVQESGEMKCKGGMLVRGIEQAGAWRINNNAPIIPKATIDYLVNGIPARDTVYNSENILDFQIISKVGGKYTHCYQMVGEQEVEVQKVNRVYAVEDYTMGTIYKVHAVTKRPAKVEGLPMHVIVDNENHLGVEAVDRDWYVRQAEKQIREFLGEKLPRRNTRKINALKKEALEIIGGQSWQQKLKL